MNRVVSAFLGLAAAVLPLAPTAARAADAPSADARAAAAPADVPAGRTLTLDEALRAVQERNRDVEKAKEYQKYVRGKYVEERSAALPQLSLDLAKYKGDDETQKIFAGGGFEFPTQSTTRTADVSVSQALFTWGQVGAAIRAAKVGLAMADDQLRVYRQAAARDVTAAFDDVLLARELAAIAEQNVAQKQRHLDEARRKHLLGTATDYDVLAADVALQNARPEMLAARNAVRTTRDQLRFLLAVPEDVDAAGALPTAVGAAPDYDAALAVALRERPDLSAQGRTVSVYRELLTIAKAGDKPRLDFKGSYGWKDWDIDIARARGKTWSAGVYLHFPFFDGLKTVGKVRQAASDLSTQEIERKRLEDQISLQVRTAVNSVRESGEVVRALEGTVTQAERLLQMAEKGFELGVKTRLEVEDAELNLRSARGNLAKARRDHHVALVTLQYVTGTIPVAAPATAPPAAP